MSNSYGAFAAITTDLAGTEHAVWEHQGLLWHAVFDENANRWVEGSPISDATGGQNLQLIAGELIPYTVTVNGIDETLYAPGIVALWEDDGGDLYYVVGRFNDQGNVEWSNQIEFGEPDLNDPDLTVLSQNPQAAITPEVITQGGNTTAPAVAVVYEVSDSGTEYVISWQGRDGSDDYQVIFRFEGSDSNEDGLISGRGTNNSLGDDIENELLTWSMEVFDPDANLVVSYDLTDQLLLDDFNFNFDVDNEVLLVNADADVFDSINGEYGLKTGLDGTVDVTGVELWQLTSDLDSEEIILQQTDNGNLTTESINDLDSTVFAESSVSTDDTDLYSEFISFEGDASTSDTLTDQNDNEVVFEAETTVSPNYQSLGPEVQYLTQDQLDSSSEESTTTSTLLTSTTSSQAITPIGSSQGFILKFGALSQVSSGKFPLPSSIVPTNQNQSPVLSGSIGAVRIGKSTYQLKTTLSLGLGEITPITLDGSTSQFNSLVEQLQNGENSSNFQSAAGGFSETASVTVTLSLISTFEPDADGDLQYVGDSIELSIGYAEGISFKIKYPALPKSVQGAIASGSIALTYLNLILGGEVSLETKTDADGNVTTSLLPLRLEGNVQDGSVELVNQIVEDYIEDDGDSNFSKGLTQFLAAAGSALGPNVDFPSTNSSTAVYTTPVQAILGLVYTAEIIDQIVRLFEGVDQDEYTVESFGLSLDYLPSIAGSAKVFDGLISGSASGSIDFGTELTYDLGADQIQLTGSVTEKAKASGNLVFWSWSWSEGWDVSITSSSSLDATETSESETSLGEVVINYAPSQGSDTLYQTEGVVRADLSSPTSDTLNDLTDDDDVALVFEPITGKFCWLG